MLRKIAVLAVMSTLAFALSAPVFADSAVVMRVVTVKTDDVTAYMHELDSARVMLKRLGIAAQIRAWRATFAGPNTGSVAVTQEFASMTAFADAMTKIGTDPEYAKWLKNLDKVRTIVSDSLYKEL